MAVLAHAALPAEVVRSIAVAGLPLLVVLALEEHLHTRVDESLTDEANAKEQKQKAQKRVKTLYGRIFWMVCYLRVGDCFACLGSLLELKNVSFSLVGAPEWEISDPVRRILRVLLLEFIRVGIIWRAQSFIIHEIRLDRNLFLLLHLFLLKLVLVLILRDVRLKLGDLHLFATVTHFVDRKVAAIELARVEHLA